MQLNIFAKTVPLLEEKNYEFDFKKIIDFLGYYTAGNWVYPSAIHRNIDLPIINIYAVLEELAEMKLIERFFEIYCPSCNKYTGNVFDTLAGIPEIVYCPHCDYEIEKPYPNAFIVYKVL